MQPGDFVKWTMTDEEGTFSYVGKLTQYDDDQFTMESRTDTGLQTFLGSTLPCEGTLELTRKPRNWIDVADSAPPTQKRQTEKVRKAPKAGSKKEQALQLVSDIFGKGHGKNMTIQRLKDVLNMTDAGATTYFYACKKELCL